MPKKSLTINKFRGSLYKGAKILGDVQAVLGVSKALQEGKPDKALNIAKRREVTRVGGKVSGRGLGYMRRKTPDCFIATTVYGENSEQVRVLRDYRDNFLIKNFGGRKLVNLYYSGIGEKVAYFFENKIPRTIPLIRRCLDFLVENIEVEE